MQTAVIEFNLSCSTPWGIVETVWAVKTVYKLSGSDRIALLE